MSRSRPSMMNFRLFDAGALERSSSAKNQDCQVRALTTVTGMSYEEAWDLLYLVQGEKKACGFTLVESLNDADPRFHIVRKLPFVPVKGKPRMNGYRFLEKYKKGRFILRMANHVVAVKDGILYDTHDCRPSCVYTAWEVNEYV